MARQLRIKVLLNKGRTGISLHKLPKLLAEVQQFLDMLSEDVNISKNADWLGFEFVNSSLGYTAVKTEPVEESQAETFNSAFKGISQRKPPERVRRATLAQYAKIADPIEPDEVVSFGLEDKDIGTLPGGSKLTEIQWLELTKEQAFLIAREAQSKVSSYGSVQGVIHSLFLGSRPPHFQLRELASGDLISCVYDRKHYHAIAAALQTENAVLHVYGYLVTDLASRKIEEMQVNKITVAHTLTPQEFEKFFGCAPDLTGQLDLQEFIDRSRGRG